MNFLRQQFRHFWVLLRCLAGLVLFGVPTLAQTSVKSEDLTQSSIEDLMNVTVTSVSKTEQTISRTAAAIFVITQDDIQRSGATNIPDLLRMVPGADVAQISANKWAVSIRGLNGLYSNELLVLVDGRLVYTQTTGGVFWDVVDLPLEDLARIEVIRGPGGAIWGANAVNGVVNIITKRASETHGGLISYGGGNSRPEFGTVQFGGAMKSTDYRVFAKYFNQNQYPGLLDATGNDGWHVLRGGFRSDTVVSAKDRLTVEGDIYTGREGLTAPVLTSVLSPGPQSFNAEANLSGGFLQSVWERKFSDSSDTSLQFSYDRYERENGLHEARGTFDIAFQHHIAVRAHHDLVWGAEARTSGSHSSGGLFLSLQPADIRTVLFGVFLQDEITLIPNRLFVTMGTKIEHNRDSHWNEMPSARIAWLPSERQTLWTAVSRAIRTPADTDTSIRLNFAGVPGPGGVPSVIGFIGNPGFRDENLFAVEVGYRVALARSVSADIASYYDMYTAQQTDEPAAVFFETLPAPPHFVIPSTYGNLMNGDAQGLEVFVTWKPTPRWTLSPGYAFERVHMRLRPGSQDDGSSVTDAEGSAPAHSAQLRSHFNLRSDVSWDIAAYFTGRVADPEVPSYTRVDTNLSWRPRERMSISVVGQNLLKDRHFEYEDSQGSVASTLLKRSVFGKITWSF